MGGRSCNKLTNRSNFSLDNAHIRPTQCTRLLAYYIKVMTAVPRQLQALYSTNFRVHQPLWEFHLFTYSWCLHLDNDDSPRDSTHATFTTQCSSQSLLAYILNFTCTMYNVWAENNVGILHKIRFLGQKPEISILTVHTLPTPPPQDVNTKHFQENDPVSGHMY